VFIVLNHDHRKIVHFNVTEHSSAHRQPSRSWTRFRVISPHVICYETGMESMVILSNDGSRASVSRRLSRRLDHLGKIRLLSV
jgi:hypothetical protein